MTQRSTQMVEGTRVPAWPSSSLPEFTILSKARPSVAYIVSTWPSLSQTFVLNEVLALERRGLQLRIFSLKDPKDEPVHADARQVRAKARTLFQRLAVAPPALERDAMCAGHGDYKPEHQFLLLQGPTVTFDWDCYDIADPCRDAALFVIYLERLALSGLGSIRALHSASQAFLKTSLAAGQPGVAARLPFHKAALYLQEAKRDLGEQHPGWLGRAEIMLDHGLQAFES